MHCKNRDKNGIKIYSTIQEFEANIPNTVKILKTSNSDKVYLIGTTHFSRKSYDDVSLVIRNVKPDGLVLELCPSRLHIIQFDENTLLKEALRLNTSKIIKIFKEHGVVNGTVYLSFLRRNAKITRKLGIIPGGECRTAITEVKHLAKCKVFLGDRELKITFDRALFGLPFKERLKMSMEMNVNSRRQNLQITEEYIEMLKESGTKSLEQIKIAKPSIYKAFVLERDYILAHSMIIAIDKCRASENYPATIVGVVGISHIKGIVENFGKTDDRIVKELVKSASCNDQREFMQPINHVLKKNSNYSIKKNLKYLFTFQRYWKRFK